MDKTDLPPEVLPEEVWLELMGSTGLQRFIRENFGLYQPPDIDYQAIRAENIRRTLRNRALGG